MADEKSSKYKVKIPKLNAKSKTYTFTLSLPGVISVAGCGVLALTFFFVMGVLIGRGYRPEADVPQLAEIMPRKEHGQTEITEPPKPVVLTAEELEFPDRLKDSPQKVMSETVPDVEEATKPKPAPKPDPQPTQAATDSGPEKPEVYEPTAAKPGEPVFDYVYQVASFRQGEMAEALSDKLNAKGLKTAIQAGEAKGTTWHRVQVFYHGTPASTAEMKAILTSVGIGKPLLVKKSPTAQ